MQETKLEQFCYIIHIHWEKTEKNGTFVRNSFRRWNSSMRRDFCERHSSQSSNHGVWKNMKMLMHCVSLSLVHIPRVRNLNAATSPASIYAPFMVLSRLSNHIVGLILVSIHWQHEYIVCRYRPKKISIDLFEFSLAGILINFTLSLSLTLAASLNKRVYVKWNCAQVFYLANM